jgi:hypothetical protein
MMPLVQALRMCWARPRRHCMRLLTMGALFAVAVFAGCASGADREQSPSRPAIVYMRPADTDGHVFDVMLRASGQLGGVDRRVCRLRNPWLGPHERLLSGPPVPDAVGILPSPTADWVLVWDGGSQRESFGHPDGAMTEWSAVRLRDAARVKLAESAVDPWAGVSVVPSWSGHETIALRDAKGTKTVSVVGPPPTSCSRLMPFPSPGPGISYQWTGAEGSELLVHAGAGLRDCVAALRQTASALELAWNPGWTMHREEWACALSSGIPLPPRARGRAGPGVQASPSPDGTKLAVADRGVRKRMRHRHPLRAQEEVDGVRLRAIKVPSGKQLWRYEVFPRAIEYGPGEFHLGHPPMPLWTDTSLQDLRWSPDEHYLSFTLYSDPRYEPAIPTVHVVDAQTWREVLVIENAVDAFVLSAHTEGT